VARTDAIPAPRLLVGDVGGTWTRLALVRPRGDGGFDLVVQRRYPSRSLPDLETALRRFRTETGEEPVAAAVVGVAGPVAEGRARISKLPWTVEAARLAALLGTARVELVNDFQLVGHALPHLRGEDLAPVQDGEANPTAVRLVLGPGTGLGHALVLADGRVLPSEAGHADFAPRGPEECALQAFLAERHGHASVERVLSGPGLVDLYRFARHEGYPVCREVEAALAAGDDAAPLISAHGRTRRDPACTRAVTIFVEVLGRHAGNMTLAAWAVGGVFLAGGVAPPLLPQLRSETFRRAFAAKGRFEPVLQRVPIVVIVHPEPGLLGAAALAARLLA